MALPYYIGEMVKSMSQDSIVLEAELEMQGYPNLFKSTPVVTSKEWDLLQTRHRHNCFKFECVQVQETGGRRDICWDVES